MLEKSCPSRTRRERKVPVKFDPSDVSETKVTSRPVTASKIIGFDGREDEYEADILLGKDWMPGNGGEETEADGNSSHELRTSFVDVYSSSQCSIEKNMVQTSRNEVECTLATGGQQENSNCEITTNEQILVKGSKKRTSFNKVSRRVKRRRSKGPYQCDHCSASFELLSIFTKHMQSHESVTGRHSFSCKICGKLLSSNVNLQRHMMIHNGKPFTCDVCSKTFTARYLLKEHLVVEHDKTFTNSQTPTDYQCDACTKYLSCKIALQYHLAIMHSCLECETKWPCKNSLRVHMLDVHDKAKLTEDGRLVCEECSKTFMYRQHYLNHIAQHNEEKKHECPKCNKCFSTCQALYMHNKQVHEKHNYRHPCSMCDKVFICKAKLVEHVRTHTGEKPFACNECNVAFAAKATYKTHMKLIHSNTSKQRRLKRTNKADSQYKYKCPLCDTVDLKADQLESHVWNVHNVTVQFSNNMPVELPDHNIVVVDSTKDIVLLREELNSPLEEERKEIVLSEGSSEIIVLEGCSEIVVAEEHNI